MQTVLFWIEHKTLKWEFPHVIYVLSSAASLIGIVKAIYVYNLRYEVVIRGFEDGMSVDDAALAFELIKEGKLAKFDKVFSRMELHHGKDISQWWKDSLKTQDG